MGMIRWGAEPELFGPRHAHREGRILRALTRRARLSPGSRHLECAAGIGSLSQSLAARGPHVVAADRSLTSLVELRRRDDRLSSGSAAGSGSHILPVVADITCLPFAEHSFDSASSAETLEHIQDHEAAIAELSRVLRPGAWLVGTVPAEGRGWRDWDRWAGHLRRYSRQSLGTLLCRAGFEARVVRWGWPIVWLYDQLFLRRINRRRLALDDELAGAGPRQSHGDRTLRAVAGLGRRRWLVGIVRAALALDRLADGAPWGVGLLFEARRIPAPGPADPASHRTAGSDRPDRPARSSSQIDRPGPEPVVRRGART